MFSQCEPSRRPGPLQTPRGPNDALIWGIVLAAGRSRRMGQPKALLPVAGDTFLQRAVETMRAGGCHGVTVVVRPLAERGVERIAAAAGACGAHIVRTASAEGEQIDSLRQGIRSLEAGVDAAVVMPVDFPLVDRRVVEALIAAFRSARAPVVVPAYEGRHGHPVLFSREVFPELFADPLPEGARTVVHAHAHDLAEVPVDEAGILRNVNTPSDYRRIVGLETLGSAT